MLLKEKQRIYLKIIEFQQEPNRRNRFNAYMLIAVIYIGTLNSLYYFNVIISNLSMLPQILKNLHRENIPRVLISVLILVQLFLTLYVTCFPYNFLVWEPDLILTSIVVCVCISQILLMYWSESSEIQVPLINRQMNLETVARIVEEAKYCSICLENLESVDIVVTRCNHAYHNSCLQRWIIIRPICPICRTGVGDLLMK